MKESGFQFSAREGSTELSLSKTVDQKRIEILFEAKLLAIDQNRTEEAEKKYLEANKIKTVITVTDDSKPKALVIEGFFIGTQLDIRTVVFTDDLQAHLALPADERNNNTFAAEFGEVNLEIQAAAYDYLESFGLRSEFLSLLWSKGGDREFKLYKNWLKDFKQFTTI